MSRKDLSIHFYTKILLITIIIPYAFYFMIFAFNNELAGKAISLLLLVLLEYTFFKLALKEYRKATGYRPKFKPNKKQFQSKEDKKTKP